MAFKLEDVPQEVQNVWAIQIASEMSKTGVSSKVWEDCQRVISAYPEWFPTDPNTELPNTNS